MQQNTLSTKPHYPILDGLRGVASLTVVAFHLCEAHTANHHDQIINHGYLAVDFFFLLSGFVIGYAYDDRWHKMSVGNFLKRRLIRLQPMVIMGMIIGATCFYFQSRTQFPLIGEAPVGKMLLVFFIGCFMIPVPPSMDVRGWQETYPLNGPCWSLLYEYVVNILYGIIVRRFTKWILTALVVIAAVALVHLAVTSAEGDLIGGWSLEPAQLHVGFTRVMYPFFAGLLMFRVLKIGRMKNGFLWSSLLLLLVLATPRVGGTELWINGLYDSLSVIFIFPIIVFMGASGQLTGNRARKTCKFLADLSYPLYITHYPLIYIYTGWVRDNKITLGDGLPFALLVYFASILIAFSCFKFYDQPVRAWLRKKFNA